MPSIHAHSSRGGSAAEGGPGIDFGDFHLDLLGGLLVSGDARIPLRAKTWAVLRYLADRPGVLVTKDELLDAIWPGVVVTPDTLSKSIGELRGALGDDSRAPRFIETVHRRGFRFLAEARPAAPAAAWPGHADELADHAAPAADRPFVGRGAELARLEAALARARAGERQIVFVTGGSGVGKSALIDAFLASPSVHQHSNTRIAQAGCFEHHGPLEPYLPVLEALERLTRLPEVEPLVELMRRVAPSWLVYFPWLIGETEAEQVRQAMVGVGVERMSRELAVLIDALTSTMTLVLVLEDLHWSDPSTVDLLTLLARRRAPARLLVIGTYRQAELVVHGHVLGPAARSLSEQRRLIALPLADLDEEAVHDYLGARFPGSRLPAALGGLIHAHTGGHPLFMVGIVDHLRSRGWIVDTAPGWDLSAPTDAIDLGVPDDVRQMIATQLHRLDPAQRAVLEAASVAGQQITPPVLATALGRDIGEVEDRCETLAAAGQFLRVAGTIESPAGDVARRYSFTHALRQQVAYDEIPEGRRTRLHRDVGHALEAIHDDRAMEIAATLAVHFQRGRLPARAVHFLVGAGARARRLGASREALAYFEPALVQLGLLPDGPGRWRSELDLRLTLGRSLGDVHGFVAEPVGRNYERASELCVALGAEAELCEVLSARWYLHAVRAEREETVALATELDGLAQRLADPAVRLLADSVLVRTAVYMGDFIAARRHMTSIPIPAAAPPKGKSLGYGADPAIAATTYDALALWFLGDQASARSAAAAGVAAARLRDDPFTLSAALMHAALVDLLAREAVSGAQLADESAALAAEHGFAFWSAIDAALSGWASIQRGDMVAGRQTLQRALAGMAANGIRLFTSFVHAFLAEAGLRDGATADGLAHANAGIALTEISLDAAFTPELWRLKGELLRASATAPAPPRRGRSTAPAGDATGEAEQCFLRALELARAAEAKSLELRAASSLARAWRDAGRIAEASALLTGACAGFDPRLSSVDLEDARGLRDQLALASGARPPRRRAAAAASFTK